MHGSLPACMPLKIVVLKILLTIMVHARVRGVSVSTELNYVKVHLVHRENNDQAARLLR
jgi:hypothetical protein